MEENISDRIVAKFKSIIHRIGTAFRQERTRELFTFLGFVLLSLIFWFMQGLNEEVENSFKIPIELQNLPEKTTLINDLPSHIEVRVRDKGPVLLGKAKRKLTPHTRYIWRYTTNWLEKRASQIRFWRCSQTSLI